MSLDEFSMTTSLHGWHFIVNARDWKQKIGWIILIGLSIGDNFIHFVCIKNNPSPVIVVAVYSVCVISEDFFRSKVDITIDSPSASLEDVKFPSVTVCNINQVLGFN